MNPILALMLAIAIVGSNSLVLGPIAATVASSFTAISASDVMVASACFGLGTAVSALLIAPKADVFGLVRSLRYSLALLLIGFAISTVSPVFWVLCVGQTLAGIASGVTLPCTYSLAADLAPKGQENETLGKVLLGWTLSMVIGVSAAAFIADNLHWRWVYLLLVLGACGVLFCVRHLNDSSSNVQSASDASNNLSNKLQSQSLWQALTLNGVASALLSVIAFMAAFYGVYGFLGTHINVTLKATPSTAGIASLLYGIGFGLAVFFDKWMDRFGSVLSRAAVFSLLVLNYIAIALASNGIASLLVLCFTWGAVNHLALNLLVAHLTALQPTQRAAIMGLYSAITYLTMFLGTLAFKALYDAYGFNIVSITATLCILPLAAKATHNAARRFRSSLTA